jgi:hypothetical protein
MSQIDQIVSIIVSNIAIITSEVATCIAQKKDGRSTRNPIQQRFSFPHSNWEEIQKNPFFSSWFKRNLKNIILKKL